MKQVLRLSCLVEMTLTDLRGFRLWIGHLFDDILQVLFPTPQSSGYEHRKHSFHHWNHHHVCLLFGLSRSPEGKSLPAYICESHAEHVSVHHLHLHVLCCPLS